MSEFAARSLELFSHLEAKENGDKANIENDLRTVAIAHQELSGEEVVPQLAQQIKDRLIKTYSIITFPKAIPAYDGAKATTKRTALNATAQPDAATAPRPPACNPKSPRPSISLIQS